MLTAGIAGASGPVPACPEPSRLRPRLGIRPRAISLNGRRHVRAQRTVTFRGHLTPASTRRVVIRVGGTKLRVRTNEDGGFRARWRPSRAGVYEALAQVEACRFTLGSCRSTSTGRRPRPITGPACTAEALACGGALSAGTAGSRTSRSPCGTRLQPALHGKHRAGPVIDRGPTRAPGVRPDGRYEGEARLPVDRDGSQHRVGTMTRRKKQAGRRLATMPRRVVSPRRSRRRAWGESLPIRGGDSPPLRPPGAPAPGGRTALGAPGPYRPPPPRRRWRPQGSGNACKS